MRRTSRQALVPDGIGMTGPKWARLTTYLGQPEQCPAAPRARGKAALGEEPISDWEKAWIDIGGEG